MKDLPKTPILEDMSYFRGLCHLATVKTNQKYPFQKDIKYFVTIKSSFSDQNKYIHLLYVLNNICFIENNSECPLDKEI